MVVLNRFRLRQEGWSTRNPSSLPLLLQVAGSPLLRPVTHAAACHAIVSESHACGRDDEPHGFLVKLKLVGVHDGIELC